MGASESIPQSGRETFTIGDEYSNDSDIFRLWTKLQACTKGRNKGTLFSRKMASSDEGIKEYFENGIKCLRQIRHPCILQFVHSESLCDEMRLYTERVQVLDFCIDSQCAIEIRAGLRSILEGLLFLHKTAALSHNNVSPSSIFVAEDGSWRLGGLEFSRGINWECGEVHERKHIENLLRSEFFRAIKPSSFIPQEDELFVESTQRRCARDVFGLGKLVEYTCEFVREEEGQEEVVKSFLDAVDRMTATSISHRIQLQECLNLSAFNNPLSEVESFIRVIQTKNDEEKDEFFNNLPHLLHSLPPRVVGRRLSHSLLSRYILIERSAHIHLLPSLLQPAPIGFLPTEMFRLFILPECTIVLRVRDVAIRLAILEHFHRFVQYYSEEELEGVVLNEILIGLEDSDDRVVASSLMAMAILVPLLGADAVVEGRRRRKIFSMGTPKNCSTVVVPTGTLTPSYTSSSRTASPIEEEKIIPFNTINQSQHIPIVDVVTSMNWEGNEDGWGEEWKEEESLVNNEIVIEKKEQKSLIIKKEEIGSEFAVKATVKNEVDDVFADMQPDIKTAGTIIEQLEKLAVEKKRSNRLEFTSEMEEEGDWGEEADINVDEESSQ